jgi:hypothetical protein
MMTKSDLQQIGNVIDERLDIKLEQNLKPVKKELRYIKKIVDIIAKNYDEGDVKLDRRVKQIEQHLALSNN